MRFWSVLNEASGWCRVPVKLVIFAIVLVLVLFPRPRLLVRQIYRLQHLDQMIDPQAPELDAVVERFQANLPENLTPRQIRKRVQAFVYETIPYDWDWNTWDVADYIPTVGELLAKGREDCDGRAVLAASLLRRLGQEASLATDLRHIWVVVKKDHEKDELMGPGGRKSAVSTPRGTRVNWRTVGNVPRSLAFGVAVFPLSRELIVLVTLIALLLHPKMSRCWLGAGVALLLGGWVFLRLAVTVSPDFRGHVERDWASWVGLVLVLVGMGCLTWASRRGRRKAGAGDSLGSGA